MHSYKFGLMMIFTLCLHEIHGFRGYLQNFPNSDAVPNPCSPSTIYEAVGHVAMSGGGPRNPFGVAYSQNSGNWVALCPLDSDNDGFTNGAELGDPNCNWRKGNPNPSSSGITHPGICTPVDSARCASQNYCGSVSKNDAIKQRGISLMIAGLVLCSLMWVIKGSSNVARMFM